MDLAKTYPANELPTRPFVGLFGNHNNNWRKWVKKVLERNGIGENQVYDSTQDGWKVINDENGDAMQRWIDELVARQHEAMKAASCLIFSMDSRTRTWDLSNLSASASVPAPSEEGGNILATRCELGWLAGIKKRTFVWVPDDLQGRNYLRAVIKLYPILVPVDNLYTACILVKSHLGKDGKK